MSTEQTAAQAAASAPPQAAGRIADLTYRNYDGPLRTRTIRWWTIALSVVRRIRSGPAGNRIVFLMLAGLILVSYLIAGAILYANDSLAGAAAAKSPALENRYGIAFFHCLNFSNFILFLAALVAGAGSIADDNRSNALLVYLSKPITKTDYVLGKWVGVFVLLAVISWTPAFALYTFFAGAFWDKNFVQNDPALVLRMSAATLAPALLHASLIVGFSAWFKSARAAGAAYAAFFFLAGIVSSALGNLTADRAVSDAETAGAGSLMSASVGGVVNGIGVHVYNITADYLRLNNELVPPLYFVLGLGALLVVLPLLAARLRIRAVEVVKG